MSRGISASVGAIFESPLLQSNLYLPKHQVKPQFVGEAVEVSLEPLFRYGAGNLDIDVHLENRGPLSAGRIRLTVAS